nr:PQQ-binding-like beta-propeller repeat protein [Flexivirga oryzae]
MRQQAIPASVSRVAWSAAVGDDVSDVVRVTGGVAVLTYTEVVGVDGRSGRRTWSFARPGADLVSIRSNGGSRVLVTWVGGSAAADRPYLTVLDGATGRTLFTRPWDVKASGEGAWDLVSGDTLVVHRAEDRRVEGFSLSTGDRSWTFDAAKGCTVTGEALRTTIGVVVEEQCGGRGQLISLNDDGEVRWRRRATMPARPHASPGPGLPLATNLDGSLVTVRWATEDVPSRYGVLDARTGRRVTGDRAYGQPLLGQVYALDESSDREHGLRNVRTGATVDAGFRNSTCRGVIGSIGIDLRGGIVCLSKSALSSLDGSGGAVVTMQRWGGASRDIPASLGAPVDVGDPGSLEDRTLRDMLAYYAGLGRVPLRVIDAQGAVVVWAPSSDGTKLIGLR